MSIAQSFGNDVFVFFSLSLSFSLCWLLHWSCRGPPAMDSLSLLVSIFPIQIARLTRWEFHYSWMHWIFYASRLLFSVRLPCLQPLPTNSQPVVGRRSTATRWRKRTETGIEKGGWGGKQRTRPLAHSRTTRRVRIKTEPVKPMTTTSKQKTPPPPPPPPSATITTRTRPAAPANYEER